MTAYLLFTMRPQKFSDKDILEKTRDCLLAHGVGVSTQVIAQSVGMSEANIFKRFGTKENLIKKSLLHSIESHPIFSMLSQSPRSGDALKQLEGVCMALVTFFDPLSLHQS